MLRLIPNKILTFEEIGLPTIGRADLPPAARDLPGHRADRLGQDHHAGVDDQLHQRELRPAHRHDAKTRSSTTTTHKKSIVNQREVGVDVPNFSEALRRVLRQDPDVILVGEMRDLETIEAAITRRRNRPPGLRHAAHHRRGRAPSTASSTPSRPTSRSRSACSLANNLIAVLCRRCARDRHRRHGGRLRVHVRHAGHQQPDPREQDASASTRKSRPARSSACSLLDDHLWMLFQAGKISAEEAIDKSKNPGGDGRSHAARRDHRRQAGRCAAGRSRRRARRLPSGKPAAAPAAAPSEAERQAQIAANRARMQALAGKK